MGREHSLYSNLVKVKANDRTNLLYALRELSSFDCDFNGENGLDYAWEETIEAGFVSNLEYLIDKVKDIKNDIECVTEFVNTWMAKDEDYYDDYKLEYLTDSNGNIVVINLAVMTCY